MTRRNWTLIPLLMVLAATAPAGLRAQTASAVPGVDGAAVDARVASLRADIDRLIRDASSRSEVLGVLVVSMDRGDTLYARAADQPLAPASNAKLLTTAAALYYLGPRFRYTTFLIAGGEVRDGVLAGDLIVYGTGDPTISGRFNLSRDVWQAFADTLAALGVRRVDGDVVGDASYFAGRGTADGWQTNYIDAAYAAPAGALSFAENVATLQISPTVAGARPEVTLIPGGAGIGIVNLATTTRSGRTSIRAGRTAYGGPLTVHGQIAASARPVLRSMPVSDPARYAAAAFREILAASGIAVVGEVRSIERSEESPVTGRSVFAPALDASAAVRVIAVHQSPPLLEILEVINKESQNFMAEQVLRTVGRVATGEGSVEGGLRAVRHMFEQDVDGGLEAAVLDLQDGSGLSALNRTSARTFVHLLSYMASSPMWESYWYTLPEAGRRDGLLRMRRTPAEGNLRAKTGTINRVSALSGYVRAANDEQLAFSIMANNVPSTWRAKRLEDAIGARLARFDRPVAPAELAAAPEPPATDAAEDADANGESSPESSASAASPPAARSRPTIHEVERGETMEAIAKRYGVSVAALRDANTGVNPRRMRPGDRLTLPAGAADNTESTDPVDGDAAVEYTIRSGDTLDAIAKRYETSVASLRQANPGLDPRRLIPGRTIRIR